MPAYSADQVFITVGAILIDEGWADGEFFTLEQNEKTFDAVHSTDGMVTRFRTNNYSAIATIKLIQSSPINIALSAQFNLDRVTPGGAGIVPLLVKDGSGDSIFAAEECWIEQEPNVSYDRNPTSREWVIYCANIKRVDGGN